jgi:hypothetical protein
MKNCMVTLAAFAFPIFFVSCNQQKDGGGCTYEKDSIPATLISLVDINEKSYDALFEVDIEGHKDTLSYAGKNNGQYLFTEEVPKETLKPGMQFRYIVQKIIKGTCDPEVGLIVLKPFASLQQ